MFTKRLSLLNEVVYSGEFRSKGQTLSEDDAIKMAKLFIQITKDLNGSVYLIGNGGSAGIASHFCVDFVKTLNVRAFTLYDCSSFSGIANDFGYEYVFSKQLKVLMNSNDLLIAISSSGTSANILNACQIAKETGAKLITFSGFQPTNPLRALGDLNFYLNSMDYGLVEMGHFFLLHTLIDAHKSSLLLQSTHER